MPKDSTTPLSRTSAACGSARSEAGAVPAAVAGSVADGVVVTGVTKRFGTDGRSVLALDAVSLRVPRGRFVSIVGPSGSGKSSLLRIVAGLLEAERGTVTVFGEPCGDARRNKHIGYVPQRPALLEWRSVLDNVDLAFQVNSRPRDPVGRAARRARAHEVLAAVGLDAVADRRPRELSGGMQQRVAIARALAFDPAVLLMDEPFSSLDELTREQLRHELLRLFDQDEKTVLFVTHSISEAVLLSDVVVVLSPSPGRVVGEIAIPLPRPRGDAIETTAAYHELEDEVRTTMRGAWDLHVR